MSVPIPPSADRCHGKTETVFKNYRFQNIKYFSFSLKIPEFKMTSMDFEENQSSLLNDEIGAFYCCDQMDTENVSFTLLLFAGN
jgi:hypothetical protein